MIRTMSPTRLDDRGFTLIELILVITIIALLATLLFPAFGTLTDRAQSTKCLNNLRQIGISAQLAATENENRYPPIEVDIKNPIFKPEDNAKPLLETLRPYGVTEQVLQCPVDLKTFNWYAKLQTSYMWSVVAEDELANNIMIYRRRGAFPGKLSRIRLAHDYEPIHPPSRIGKPKTWNSLYADGHVQAGGGR